jgi:acyl carrier protein
VPNTPTPPDPDKNKLPAKQTSREIVLHHLRETLQLPDGEPVPIHRPLKDLGLDSMLAIELRNNLSKAFNRPLPATVLFDYPTAHEVIKYLSGDAGNATPAESPRNGSVPHIRPVTEETVNLTLDEAEKLLVMKLDQLATREWR